MVTAKHEHFYIHVYLYEGFTLQEFSTKSELKPVFCLNNEKSIVF